MGLINYLSSQCLCSQVRSDSRPALIWSCAVLKSSLEKKISNTDFVLKIFEFCLLDIFGFNFDLSKKTALIYSLMTLWGTS